MAGEFIKQLKEENLCDGVHIMAIGAERKCTTNIRCSRSIRFYILGDYS